MASLYDTATTDYQTEVDNVNAQADALIAEAQGSYNYTAKWLEKEFQTALGTDDTARQEFLKKVYSAVESQIGTIPYDYEKYTERELQDYATDTSRLNEDTDLALKIAEEDYNVLKQQSETQQTQDRQTQTEGLLGRGILTTQRETAGGIPGQAVATLEGNIDLENKVDQSDYERNKEALILERTRGLTDLETNKERNLQDITDKYRRAANESITAKDSGTEAAQLKLDQTTSSINRSKQDTINQLNKLLASYST